MNDYLEGLLVLVLVVGLCVYVVRRGTAFEKKIRYDHGAGDRRAAEILATGIPMRGRILSVSDTGTRVRPHYVYALVRLRVREPAGSERELSGLVSIAPLQIPLYVPGREVVARVDPLTHEFAIDHGADAA